MAESKTTTRHDEIRSWIHERGGFPARVKGTTEAGAGGVLRVDYPGFSGEDTLERLTWDEFFDAFETNKLAFLYQDTLASGEISRFSKFIDRESADAKAA